MPENEFYSYALETTEEGYSIIVNDLDNNSYEVISTESKKVAEYILNIFDDLAIDEEQNLFDEIIE
ncbi:MAG TPA: hypothetical protein DCS66_13080 [Flavobacteriaceae bacterium]|nr:hypothetical protein [Flavobacteriaceae bacterium]|tara:strand:+ start:946 stop:1143 length:198 start_codon:yes stop_codon:yes gene_type:complete